MPKASGARAWEQLHKTLKELDLGWAFHQLPAQLRVARSADFPQGVETSHLVPREFDAFTRAVGYPVVGFSYYCQVGLSFLPPEHVETCSAMVASESGALLRPARTRRPRAHAAFFAGTDLSHLRGFAFAPHGREKSPTVWRTDARLQEPLNTFDAWAITESERIEAYARSLSARARAALKKANDGEDDPHRALNYALDQRAPHEGFSNADLALRWVCDQAKTPYRYRLINDHGVWLMKQSKPFDTVAPFRSGAAQVEVDDKVLSIDPGGRVLKDLTPKARAQSAPSMSLAGKRVTLLGSFRVMGISLGEFIDRVGQLGGAMVDPTQPADLYAVAKEQHFPENLERAKRRQATSPGVELIALPKFLKQLGLTPE